MSEVLTFLSINSHPKLCCTGGFEAWPRTNFSCLMVKHMLLKTAFSQNVASRLLQHLTASAVFYFRGHFSPLQGCLLGESRWRFTFRVDDHGRDDPFVGLDPL